MTTPRVFLSHSSRDKALVRQFKAFLDATLDVVIDERDLDPAQSISQFATESVKGADATVIIVSEHSLSSPWVVLEAVESLRNRPERLIACALDQRFTDTDVRVEITRRIDARLDALGAAIKQHLHLRLGLDDLAGAHQLLVSMRNNLGALLKQLRDTKTLDLTPETLQPVADKVSRLVTRLMDRSMRLADPGARARQVEALIGGGHASRALGPFLDLALDFASDPQQIDRATRLVRDFRSVSADAEEVAATLNRQIVDVADQLTRAAAANNLPTSPVGVVVDCVRLQKRYGAFNLTDITCDVKDGEIVGVFGRNASGKTTLLRLLAGQLVPDEGVLVFPVLFGKTSRFSWADVHRYMAYVPQELPHWHGSLQDNLHYEAAIRGIRGDENERAVRFIVERLDLAGELGKSWKNLSGGFRLRFALARALVWRPRLLLLDEPLANLDPVAKANMLRDLRDLADSPRYRLAVVISSQDIYELEAISDKVVVLERGAVRYIGDPKGIGSARTVNRYEAGGNVRLEELQDALADLEGINVRRHGAAFLVTTGLDISTHTVMQRLLRARLPLTSFRDVSNSVVSFLLDTTARW